jgi:hypothetical protein
MIDDILEHCEDYIFSAKRGDHKTLYKNLAECEYQRKDISNPKGKRFLYEWANSIRQTAKSETNVYVMRLISVYPDKNGESVSKYIGTWITTLNITNTNIVSLIQGARSRWKMENESFNTLKNQGYCMDHNFGHYEVNLSFTFYLLILLSFYVHQILELTDKLHKKARQLSGALYAFWEMRERFLIYS